MAEFSLTIFCMQSINLRFCSERSPVKLLLWCNTDPKRSSQGFPPLNRIFWVLLQCWKTQVSVLLLTPVVTKINVNLGHRYIGVGRNNVHSRISSVQGFRHPVEVMAEGRLVRKGVELKLTFLKINVMINLGFFFSKVLLWLVPSIKSFLEMHFRSYKTSWNPHEYSNLYCTNVI